MRFGYHFSLQLAQSVVQRAVDESIDRKYTNLIHCFNFVFLLYSLFLHCAILSFYTTIVLRLCFQNENNNCFHRSYVFYCCLI